VWTGAGAGTVSRVIYLAIKVESLTPLDNFAFFVSNGVNIAGLHKLRAYIE